MAGTEAIPGPPIYNHSLDDKHPVLPNSMTEAGGKQEAANSSNGLVRAWGVEEPSLTASDRRIRMIRDVVDMPPYPSVGSTLGGVPCDTHFRPRGTIGVQKLSSVIEVY